MGDMHPSLTTT